MANKKQQIEIQKATFEPAQGAFSIAQAAAYCGVRCAAVEDAVRDGRLAGRRLGRNVIVLKSDLDAFLSKLEIIPAHTPASILKRRRERLQGRGHYIARQTSSRTREQIDALDSAREAVGVR